jgi:hypothetical protein
VVIRVIGIKFMVYTNITKDCKMQDESHLPVSEQSLVFRLRKRAEIRRQIPGRLAVTEGKPDKIANLLDEAATEIETLQQTIANLVASRLDEL